MAEENVLLVVKSVVLADHGPIVASVHRHPASTSEQFKSTREPVEQSIGHPAGSQWYMRGEKLRLRLIGLMGESVPQERPL